MDLVLGLAFLAVVGLLHVTHVLNLKRCRPPSGGRPVGERGSQIADDVRAGDLERGELRDCKRARVVLLHPRGLAEVQHKARDEDAGDPVRGVSGPQRGGWTCVYLRFNERWHGIKQLAVGVSAGEWSLEGLNSRSRFH